MELIVLGEPSSDYPRYGHAATLVGGSLYAFGGRVSPNTKSNDMLKLHRFRSGPLSFWNILDTYGASPNSCEDPSMILVNDALYVYYSDGSAMMHKFDLLSSEYSIVHPNLSSDNAQRLLYSRRHRRGHSLDYWEQANSFLLFGGIEDSTFGDVQRFSLDSHAWSLVPTVGKPPEPRRGHSSYLLNEQLYICGGMVSGIVPGQGRFLAHMHVLQLNQKITAVWSTLSHGTKLPHGVADAALVYCRGVLILYGGRMPNGRYSNTVFCFDLVRKRWLDKSRVFCQGMFTGKACHTATVLPNGKEILLLGGENPGQFDSLHAAASITVMETK